MNKIWVLMLVTAALGCAGGEKEKEKKERKNEVEFFPVTSFIEGQIHQVDSLKSLTMQYHTVGDKTDTVLISIADFKQLAQDFLQPDFNDPSLEHAYVENSFADQSMNGVAFNYTTEDVELDIQRVDVLVDASAVSNDKVRSIYMEKQSRLEDTFVYKKMYWRTDKSLQIVTTKSVADQAETVDIKKVEWSN